MEAQASRQDPSHAGQQGVREGWGTGVLGSALDTGRW